MFGQHLLVIVSISSEWTLGVLFSSWLRTNDAISLQYSIKQMQQLSFQRQQLTKKVCFPMPNLPETSAGKEESVPTQYQE